MKGWMVKEIDGGIRLTRAGRERLDFAVTTELRAGSPKRLAHQVRQDLWRALQGLRGFSPVVEVTGNVVRAGGQLDGRIPGNAIETTTRLLENPRNRARWIKCAKLAAAIALLPSAATPLKAETLLCTPQNPYFCANVHVSCAGRSNIATSALKIELEDASATVRHDGKTVAMQLREDRTSKILRSNAPGYIRLMRDGRFAQRIYVKTGALMAIGRCAPSQTGGDLG